MAYLYLLMTVLFTVYGQIVLRWRMLKYGSLPEAFSQKAYFLLKLFFDPFILSCFFSAFIASLFWMVAMTKLNLSYAYPFTSLSFVLVLVFSVLLFKESLDVYKIVGLIFILIGVFISSKSL
jgi:multidrug transporter EmrE-like cation transporter